MQMEAVLLQLADPCALLPQNTRLSTPHTPKVPTQLEPTVAFEAQ
jgi:hypothetical protein